MKKQIGESRTVRRRFRTAHFLGAVFLLLAGSLLFPQGVPEGEEFVNSLGMKLVRISPGAFHMGWNEVLPRAISLGMRHFREGDFDERPVHEVTISRPFYMGVTEVTNAQFEEFDPEHKKLRGKLGLSVGDDEAVIFVSWEEAVAFTKWLSEKEGRPYRLPTEAEWEYACRAGTETSFSTGATLPEEYHNNVGKSWFPRFRTEVDRFRPELTVARTPANPWGLFDMHGNVEEWCYDWYGPYEPGARVDPVGRADGEFKVTRGGSHSTELYYLRSANRSGTLPDDRSWVIGFRVVQAEMPATIPLPVAGPELFQKDVLQQAPGDLTRGPDPDQPYFKGPRRYVKIPPDSYGPLYSFHNHDPGIAECPNGDLLAIWYTCVEEPGREVGLVASRLRYGTEDWEPASPFFDTPDRNDHAPALWFDGKGKLYHFSGLSAAATWGSLALVMRTSSDSGVTWTRPRLISPEHSERHMPIESVFRMADGTILLPSDSVETTSSIWLSEDDGKSWYDPGGTIKGVHAGVVQLKDGRLMALGRGNNIDGRMPKSISTDRGKSWTYSASPFPPISGGQRLVLIRLKEGPLFFASFAKEILVRDASGRERPVSGLFTALSYDEGETWQVKRLVSDDGPGRYLVGGAWTGRFLMGFSSAEPKGYMSVCQGFDGVIHLISSAQHYAFNLKWLETPPPAAPASR